MLSRRMKSTIEKLDNSSLKKQNRILFEEDYEGKASRRFSKEENDPKRVQKKEFDHADFLERLIIEASGNKRRRRQPSITSSNNSYQIDRLLDDEGNDWFFEKILEKFEDIRSKKAKRYIKPVSQDFDNADVSYGVERIIERRYYVKKPRSTSKRHQLTSTSDLRGYETKNRQYSGVSSVTATTTICSQCSTTPTYVENLRDQSETLRNEISDLKKEIEQLQTSQREFFQQLQTQFQSKPGLTTTTTSPPSFAPPMVSPLRSPSEKNETFGILPVPLISGKKSRSISTESHGSSSSSESTTTTTPPPSRESATKSNAASSSKPVAPMPLISEFMATKNPAIAPPPPPDGYSSSKSLSIITTLPANGQASFKPPITVPEQSANAYISSKPSSISTTPPVNEQISLQPPSTVPIPPTDTYISSIPSSIVSTPPVNGQFSSQPPPIVPSQPVDAYVNSKPSSIAPTPPVNGQANSKPPSIGPTSLANGYISSKPSSIAPTPPPNNSSAFRNPVIVQTPPENVLMGPIHSRTSSVAPMAPVASSFISAARVPVYENELAHRRVLSPRSQIVASAASIQESSDSSSGSISPELVQPNPVKVSKPPVTPLRINDLNELVRYSSQLELSGFPPSVTPVISNPNTSTTFWDSVDQYIQNPQPTNINIGLPPIPRSNHGNRSGLNNNNTTKQLDKYDLEIKPQGFIQSSAPLLMPPLDILW